MHRASSFHPPFNMRKALGNMQISNMHVSYRTQYVDGLRHPTVLFRAAANALGLWGSLVGKDIF